MNPGTAPAVLLMGAPGAGKSYSLATLLACNLELFLIGTEPRCFDSLYEAAKAKNYDLSRIHSSYIAPIAQDFASMLDTATRVANLNYQTIADLKSGLAKDKHTQFLTLIQCLNNFKDEAGKTYGSVDTFGPDRVVVIDSLSGVNLMAKSLVVGAKPSLHQGEWGTAMELEEQLINKLCSTLSCPFVLTAHIEREPNELTGAVSIQVGALGRKLAPRLPRFFSEVVLAYREKNSYFWSTSTDGYELKKRSLPLADRLPPDFTPIINAWREREAELSTSKIRTNINH